MNEKLSKMVGKYIDLIMNNQELYTELEVKFGTRNFNKITKIDFDNVIQCLKSNGFVANSSNGVYNLKIQNSYFDKNINKVIISNIRTEIHGIYNIQQYCRTNEINIENQNKFVKKIRVKDESNKFLEPINYDDFNFRITLNTEEDLNNNNNQLINMLNNWDKNNKIFRYINRISFYNEKYPVRIDCSIVKSSRKENNKLIADKNIQDSNVFNNPITYEIEIELLHNKIIGNYKKPDELIKSIKNVIKIVLSGLQNTNYPIGNNEINSILNDYQSLIFKEENKIPTYKLNSYNFIGPSNITLQISNIIENEESKESNILNNYTVTEKADGIRKLCYINNDGKIYFITTSLKVEFTGTVCKNKEYFNSLIDGEHILYNKKQDYINLYAVFDLYFIKGQDIRNLDFVNPQSKEKSRLVILNDLIKKISLVNIVNNDMSDLRIEIKTFYTTSDDNTIFDGCKLIMDKVNNNLFEYETDGLIFTPMLNGVGMNDRNNKPPNYKSTWEQCFKWKPPKYNTIDFLISTVKTNNTDKISLLYNDGKNMIQNNQINKYKTLTLMVGFDIKKHGYLNPCENMLNGEFKSIINKDNNENYKPMPFYPTNPYIEAHTCNILLKPDANNDLQMFTNENEVIEDNMIVEFSYNIENEQNWRWEPLRIRYDKTSEYRNNMKNYGNAYHVANSNWQSIHNPITLSMITTGKDIPKYFEENDVYYNNKNKSFNTLGLRDFHNLWIKNKLIKTFTNQGSNLIDLSVGKAGDLPKWRNNNLNFVFGIDISKDNLENKLDGACARYLKSKERFTNTPDCIFVHGDSGLDIISKNAFYNDKGKKIWSSLYGDGTKDEKTIGKIPSKYYGIANNGFDNTSCQFSIHYFFQNNEMLNRFIKNVVNVTKLNGRFIGTSFDGRLLFKKLYNLKMNENIIINKDDNKIWEVTKLYDNDKFENNSTCVGYPINVYQESINKTFKEYLVNFDYLVRLFENYGFKLEETKLFENEYNDIDFENLDQNEKIMYKNIENISEQEKTISFLNRWFVFKKIRNVDVDSVFIEQSNETQINLDTEDRVKKELQQVIEVTQNIKKPIRKLKKKITIKQ